MSQYILPAAIALLPVVYLAIRWMQSRHAQSNNERDKILDVYDAIETIREWGELQGNEETLGCVLMLRRIFLEAPAPPSSERVNVIHSEKVEGAK